MGWTELPSDVEFAMLREQGAFVCRHPINPIIVWGATMCTKCGKPFAAPISPEKESAMMSEAPIPVAMFEAVEIMRSWGYEDDQFVGLFTQWHTRGDAIMLWANADLGSLTTRPLGIAGPIDLPDDQINGWPRHAPDSENQVGWRYLPYRFVPPVGVWGGDS